MKVNEKWSMKKWLCVLVSLPAILVGCTLLYPPEPSPPSSPTATFSPLPTPSPTLTVMPAPPFVILDVWVPDFLNPYNETTGAAVLNEQLAEFTDIYPDIQVQVMVKKASGTGGLYGLLSSAYPVAPAVLPDLVVLNQSDLGAAIEGGFIQPFEPYPVDLTSFFPFSVSGLQKDEKTYGIPLVVQADQMVYRSGISSVPPFTWTDVLTSGYSMLFPAGPENGLADDALLAIYLGSGGKVMDEQGKPTLDRATLEQLYRFFDEMIARNLLNPERVLGLTNAQLCWDVYQQGIGRLSPVPAGVFWTTPSKNNLPTWAPTLHGQPTAIAHTWVLALVTDDPFRQEASLQLALWLTSPRQTADLTHATLLLPPRVQSLEQWGLSSEEIVFLQEWLGSATPALPANVDTPVRRALQAGLRALLSEEDTTPEEAATYALTNLR
ncbi:MAG: extracellular solute-binding protein [Anaerolineae bacterium]|nr:extracellular solute-binding protein [Anaerolineae bacterium]